MLTQKEYQRYSRHLNLPQFGVEEQLKLKSAKVLVVGAGGLGAPVLQYLAAAGVGFIGIADADQVELSNLQRQVLYSENDIRRLKVEVASERLSSFNRDIEIQIIPEFLTVENALGIIEDYDLVVDGSDNFQTRYLVNDACVIKGKINVYASIYRFEGQVAVFNALNTDGSRSPNYRDLFPEPPEAGLVPDCATGGVLGVLAGIIGSMQALEAIKVITGIGSPLISQLFLYDALSSESRTLRLAKKSSVEIRNLINYDEFCGVIEPTKKELVMKEISVQDLQQWKNDGKDFQLIDVREQHEVEFVNIGGDHIPLGDIMAKVEDVSRDKDVVVMCRSGQRSGAAVQALTQQGFDNVSNLKGGILAWSREIDPSLPQY